MLEFKQGIYEGIIMERIVPVRSSEEIDLYIRTIYSLLRSTTEVQIRSLEEVHAGMNSSLHPGARDEDPDISALIYSILRLPGCIFSTRTVLLGQSASVFHQQGIHDIESWQEVSAKARRRRCYFDGKDRLACFIASRSDIDDVVPSLTALQIEWNKMHGLLRSAMDFSTNTGSLFADDRSQDLAAILHIPDEDLARLRIVLGADYTAILSLIAGRKCDLQVKLFSGSLNEYRKATQMWWENILAKFPGIAQRPVYFVSSNTHSLINPLSGFAIKNRAKLIHYIESADQQDLRAELDDIRNNQVQSSPENFFYYVLKKYLSTPEGRELLAQQVEDEIAHGIMRIPSEHAFDIEAQVIDISRLDPHSLDQRIFPGLSTTSPGDWDFLKKTDAIILNIDYPLGLAAYNLLSKIAESTGQILGIYIMGKAATLNGRRGDVMIPNVVHDEQSQNTYIYNNCFSGTDVSSHLIYGTVLDNQKAVSVMGTYLQNAKIMDVIYREGYTDIEMESGPYLSAIYEMYRPKRHPVNEIVNLYSLPFDLGILHYASDTPLTKGKNLGAGALSYFGVDSTYATTLAILRRIMQMEKARLSDR